MLYVFFFFFFLILVAIPGPLHRVAVSAVLSGLPVSAAAALTKAGDSILNHDIETNFIIPANEVRGTRVRLLLHMLTRARTWIHAYEFIMSKQKSF